MQGSLYSGNEDEYALERELAKLMKRRQRQAAALAETEQLIFFYQGMKERLNGV